MQTHTVRGAMPMTDPQPSLSRRVLVVTTDADLADTLRKLLSVWGYEAAVAGDAAAALRAAQSFAPGAALVDAGGPGGRELADGLRAAAAGAVVAVVAGETPGRPPDGFDHIVGRPLDPEALRRLVGAIFHPAPGP